MALLVAHDQTVVYVPGVMVNRAASAYRGAGKTDAKDAYVIAEQARMRRDLTVLGADDELIVELRLLVARRQDLRADRTRAVNRLHDRLVAVCPRWSAISAWRTKRRGRTPRSVPPGS